MNPSIIELTNDSWTTTLKRLRGTPKKWPSYPRGHWAHKAQRERLLKNKTYATLALLPNGKLVRALVLRDVLKECEPERLEYAEDRLILYHASGKAQLYYQAAST